MGRIARFAVVLGLLSTLGCGSGERLGVAVSGKVTFNGEPLKDGAIAFIPQPGTEGPTAGASVVDGRYSIPRAGGPFPGKYRVEINAFREVRKANKQELGGAMFGRDPSEFGLKPEANAIRENVIPARYNQESQLSAEVPDRGDVELDYALSK